MVGLDALTRRARANILLYCRRQAGPAHGVARKGEGVVGASARADAWSLRAEAVEQTGAFAWATAARGPKGQARVRAGRRADRGREVGVRETRGLGSGADSHEGGSTPPNPANRSPRAVPGLGASGKRFRVKKSSSAGLVRQHNPGTRRED